MWIKRALSKFAGRSFVQGCLERNIRISQYLTGIGSGSDVSSSGEAAIIGLLKRRCSPPYCIFDVGANKGQFLRLILQNVNVADVFIHCFEPGKETFRSLEESTARMDHFGHIELNNVGIGSAPGYATLHYDESGSELASLTKRRLEHFGIEFSGSESVRIATIDSYCVEHAITRIHLLKLDIEGHELDALEGARTMLEARAIDVVAFEFGGCNIDTRIFFRDFWYLFSRFQMDIYRVTPSCFLTKIC